eukprot:SAG31_NODE_16330_length_713_cov_1.120521_1_plen_193_part_10
MPCRLVDNAKDANAKLLTIDTVPNPSDRNASMLVLTDDGDGMDPEHMEHMFALSRSSKDECNASMIGRYGVGFKSGAMALADDALVWSKSGEHNSLGWFGKGFNQESDHLNVPIISWRVETGAIIKGSEELMRELTKRSPFNREWLTTQFQNIKAHGTHICLFGLKQRDDNTPDLDLGHSHDIQISQVRSRKG